MAVPRSHTAHSDAPSSDVYALSLHGEHECVPANDFEVPRGHLTQSYLLTSSPAGHAILLHPT